MKAFLLAFVTAFVLAGVTAFVLENFQASSDRANTTSGVRLDFARDGVNRTVAK